MENKSISKEEFIATRLANKIAELEKYVAELEFTNTFLMQELKKKEEANGEEK